MEGYTVGADGTITKDGATILEKGTRVLIAGSIYTGSIVGGDFCAGSSYVIETDFTGDRSMARVMAGSRQINAAETLLTGAAAVEALHALKAEALKAGWGVAEEYDAAIEMLGDDAETAAAKSRAGGYYRR